MAWKDIFSKTVNGHSVTVSKSFVNTKAEYTVRFGAEKKDNGGTYVSPNIPFSTLSLSALQELADAAGEHIVSDTVKDDQAEADRIKALSAKPGSMVNTKPANVKPAGVAGPVVPRDKNGPRSTGKTAKKKAKLQARADEARASASK